MAGNRTALPILVPCLLVGSSIGCAEERSDAPVESVEVGERPAAIHRIDCAGDPLVLWDAEPVVQHRDGDELQQYWLLADRPDLWSLRAPEFESLERYREQVRQAVPDTSPLGMIRTNRERNPWLGAEYPDEDKVNRQVEAGVGEHRPMNCLESHILAYQATRFPLYEQPSEVAALLLERSAPPDRTGGDDLVKVYLVADNDSVLPKPNRVLESVAADVESGWRFAGVFHNHTFDHTPDRGLIPVAAPSTSDLQLSATLAERLGLEAIQVTDGFSTLELTADEFVGLYRSLDGDR